MIYYLLYELVYFHFREKDWYLVKALNVFQYVTFRTAYATITALLISLFFGGVLIVGSVLISSFLWARLSSVYVWTAMLATLAFGAIGFIDDYSKMAKQRSLGLT